MHRALAASNIERAVGDKHRGDIACGGARVLTPSTIIISSDIMVKTTRGIKYDEQQQRATATRRYDAARQATKYRPTSATNRATATKAGRLR